MIVTAREALLQNQACRAETLGTIHIAIQKELLGQANSPEVVIIFGAPLGETWTAAASLMVVTNAWEYVSARERSTIVRDAFRWAFAQAKHDTPHGEAPEDRLSAVLTVSYDANLALRRAVGFTFREAWTEGLLDAPTYPWLLASGGASG